jgi:hypothetical protein
MASVASAIPYDGTNAFASTRAGARQRAKSLSASARIGSAPQPAIRSDDRSRSATSLSFSRLATSAYANVGAYVMVPRCWWIFSSQSRGVRTKLDDGKSTQGTLVKRGPTTNPMSPMSWNSGSQLTPLSTAGSRSRPWIMNASALAARFACVTATPLGLDVLPLVN